MSVSVACCVLRNGNVDPEVRVVKTLKDMRQRYRKPLMNEIQVLQALRHENIVQFYEAFVSEQEVRLVIEYCRGGSLDDYTSVVTYTGETGAWLTCLLRNRRLLTL